MPNTWADLNFGPRVPTYSEYQFITSKAKNLPMCLSELEYNDLMRNGRGKSGPLAWANAIEWRMFSLMNPKVGAATWLNYGYAAELRSACNQLVTKRDKAEKDTGEKRLAAWRREKKREWKEMEMQLIGEIKNELLSNGSEIKLEVQQESWTFSQTSNGPPHEPPQSIQLPFRSRHVHNQPNVPLKRTVGDREDDGEREIDYQRKKPKYAVQATVTTLQDQVAALIRSNNVVQDELKFLGKSHTSLWKAYESLKKDYQELKEKHDSLWRLLA